MQSGALEKSSERTATLINYASLAPRLPTNTTTVDIHILTLSVATWKPCRMLHGSFQHHAMYLRRVEASDVRFPGSPALPPLYL
eukprot:5721034-Amphidinium_carterae.1